MSITLGPRSLGNLAGVHPTLVAIVKRAAALSTQDFSVNEGVRTLERQKKLVASGASRTLDSMHIPKIDLVTGTGQSFGHAVDLVPFIDGTLRWEWGPIYHIAAAMCAAAQALGAADKLCWGGAWGLPMSAYHGDAARMAKAVQEYQARHPGPDFIDGPHFQIGRLK